jgi:hypothetical protein
MTDKLQKLKEGAHTYCLAEPAVACYKCLTKEKEKHEQSPRPDDR